MDDTPNPNPRPIEDRLRSALVTGLEQVEAEVGPPVADPADLARRRIDHHRRQRSARVAAVAAVVLLAAVGGWAVGRDQGPDGEDVAADAATTTTTTTTTPVGQTTIFETPDTTEPVIGPDGLPVVYPQPPDPGTDSGAAARSASATRTFAPPNQPWYDSEPLPTALATTRTLPDGATLRLRTNLYDPAVYELPPFWAPPAFCFPLGDAEIQIQGGGQSDVVRTVRYATAEDGRVDVRTALVDAGGRAPRWVTVAHGPAGTDTVEITYPGGVTDQVTPIDGLAVLSAPVGPIDLAADDLVVTVVARGVDGTELARHEAPWQEDRMDEPPPDPPSQRPACAVPTELPAPGPEQPADPAAAEAAVRAVWETAFAHPRPGNAPEQLAATDDTRGLAEVLGRVEVSPEVLAQSSIPIEEVVFVDPERAFIRYRVDIAAGTYARLFGELVLVDGRWKATRRTTCDIAETGGSICPPLPLG